MKPNTLFALLLVLLFLQSCKKDAPPGMSEMYDCHESKTWTTENTFQELLGEWKWRRQECGRVQSILIPSDDILALRFRADSTLEVIEEGVVTLIATWQVVVEDGTFFGLETDPLIDRISGRILFCEDWVEFNLGYIDGCDNYFLRK